ncbi:RDD family protein [Arcobacter sp. YIC-464]|uniref:RDD family protein n=1 Tax=Arcobacter sp. YIC-464 TaxID=3376631 RepID=UPI003C133F84
MAKWRDVKQNRAQNKNNSIKNQEEKIDSSCASLGSRLKAFLTDSFLITTPITYIVMYLVLGGGDEFAHNRSFGWALILGVTAIVITFFWYVKFQTPGMKAYSVKIVNQNKQRITFIQAVVRYLATLISMASIFLMFMPFFHKEKKTFQDLISKTIIIDE